MEDHFLLFLVLASSFIYVMVLPPVHSKHRAGTAFLFSAFSTFPSTSVLPDFTKVTKRGHRKITDVYGGFTFLQCIIIHYPVEFNK